MTATTAGATDSRPEPDPSPAPAAPRWRLLRHAPALLVGLAVVVGVLVRLHSPSVLWLDEALSVNISTRPLPELFDALRRDGSPPLFYLLLHYWMDVFGSGDQATRAMSTVFSLATLPVVWCAARRLGGPVTAWSALAVLSVTPFAVRYATETRMYALVQLLTALGVLLVLRAFERPSLVRLVPVGVVSGALALTHYWALFLLAAAGLLLLGLSVRGDLQHQARRVLAALALGGVLFLPWLPTFVFQIKHTGTPWAPIPSINDLYSTVVAWAGFSGGSATVLTLTLLGLTVLALAGHRVAGVRGVVVGPPFQRRGLFLLVVSGGTLLLGLVAGMVVGAGYAPRYSSVALIPGLLLAALGLRVLDARARTAALAVIVVAGMFGTLGMPFSKLRTQAGVTAARITAALQPGDLVVYCPDQLGPAVSRRLPAGTQQVTYPLLQAPALVDWVDYAQRNARADAPAIARQLSSGTSGAIFVVWAEGYRTFGQQCEELNATIRALRGDGVTLLRRDYRYGETQRVDRYPGAGEAAVPASS